MHAFENVILFEVHRHCIFLLLAVAEATTGLETLAQIFILVNE